MIDRRKFLLLSSLVITSKLLAKTYEKHNISMNGDLDDDLFIIKATETYNEMTHCFQMHNPKEFFSYEGNKIKSSPIYGTINFSTDFILEDSQVIVTCVANEREELFELPKLRERTHFKAVPFLVDGKKLIPSLMPEWNDVPNYPTWFGSEKEVCFIDSSKSKDYNYYKLWENAVCGVGIILPYKCNAQIHLFNEYDEKLFTFNEYLDSNPKNLISDEVKSKEISDHILTEVDGTVYKENGTETDDIYIMKNAITKMLITFDNKMFNISLPYPLPYPNRLYGVAL